MARYGVALLLGLVVSTPTWSAEVFLDWIAARNGGTVMVLADDDGFSYATTGLWESLLEATINPMRIATDAAGNAYVVGSWGAGTQGQARGSICP